MMNRLFLLLISLSFIPLLSPAQETEPVVNLSKWSGFDVLDPYVLIYVDSTKSEGTNNLNSFQFKKPPENYLNEPVSRKESDFPHYYKTTLRNDTGDTARFFILAAPQKYFQCFRKIGNAYESIPVQWHTQKNVNKRKIALLTILPDEEVEVIVRLIFPYYSEAYVYLWMVPQAQTKEFFIYQQALYVGWLSFEWIIMGMLLMMFVYIFLKFIQIKTMDYFYYGLYIFFFLVYFGLKLASNIGYEQIYYSDWYGGILNNQVQVYAYVMYFLFFQHFLNTRDVTPRLHKLLKITIAVLLFYIVLDTILFFLPDYYSIKEMLWNGLRVGLVVLIFVAIIMVLKARSPLGPYLVVGGIILSIFGVSSMIFTFYPSLIRSLPYPFYIPIAYFQIGIIGELVAFTLGLGYKNRIAEQEKVLAQAQLQSVTERQEFERYRAMMDAREEERNRIAKDLHDGVGGLLSGVKMSLTQMQNRIQLNSDDNLVFARSLDMLDGSMQEIRRVSHAMMPPSLQQFGLTVALRDFAEAINSMKTIEVVFQVVGDAPQQLLLDKQLMIYRIVQELVNNVLKHAHASKCLIQLVYSDLISITVEDDGVGFDNSETKGAGLSNIRQRVGFLKGTIDWSSIKGEGTSVVVEIPWQ